MKSSRGRTILVWAMTVPLFLMMGFVGLNKFLAQEAWANIFTAIGAPLWLMPVVGIVEIGGAALLLVPSVAALGAGVLGVTMLVATGLNVLGGQMGPAVTTVILAGTLAQLRSNRSAAPES